MMKNEDTFCCWSHVFVCVCGGVKFFVINRLRYKYFVPARFKNSHTVPVSKR